ncbi:hypothetical protein MLD38_033020 [Melastoma candidum]|nr:hypothetical protein MLD38_033020 [Melastoma candidum]
MSAITYPALVLAYTGQASFLRKHPEHVSDTFYKSIPGPLYWPMLVVAVMASIIASQAMISGTFSMILKSLSLGCFLRVKIMHTSTKYKGQVYIPEINYLLMIATVVVTIGFRTTDMIGNAYGKSRSRVPKHTIFLSVHGQASFLRKHPELASDTFYKSIPGAMYWPMFVVAVLAAAIASQAMISGTFSIIQQSLALGCFPRVKVLHTSAKFEGQVYVPGINYLLMVACVAVSVGFRTTEKIGNAYGIAVVFVMVLSSLFLGLIMIMVWKTNLLLVILYAVTIGLIELVYLSSVLYKFDQGGYLPLAFAAIVTMIMYVWNYVYCKKYYYELDHKITPERLKEIISDPNLRRMPKLALFYSELVQGIPPIFEQYLSNVPALNNVLVFISFKSLPISKVPQEERFLFRRIASDDANVYRCVVRYGYSDVHGSSGRGESFEVTLVEGLKGYIRSNTAGGDEEGRGKRDVEAIEGAWDAGVVHLVGESDVAAGKGSGIRKRITINYGYNFLKRILKQSSNEVFDIPHEKLLKVGMTYLL